MSKKLLKEFHALGGMVSKQAFDNKLHTPVHGSGVKLTSLIEGNPESWNESEQQINIQRFLEDVANYSSIGQSIYRETNLKEIAIKLSEIVEAAKIHTMNETDDWFDRVSVKRNMKELGGLAGQFVKVARESNSMQRRMETLYEDMGNILSRYYDIKDTNSIQEAEDVKDLDKPESGGKEEYQKFFNGALKKFGVDSPDDLGEEEKKEFFNWVDKNWANKK
jgi:hypothetical protein